MFSVALTGDVDAGEDLSRSLAPLVELLDGHGVNMTIPVTSACLEKFHRPVRLLADHGHEIAGHGDVHAAFRDPFDVQVERLRVMLRQFEHYLGLQPHGFRSPYLRHNADTYRALLETGFQYDSSRVCKDPLMYLRARYGAIHTYPSSFADIPRVFIQYFSGRTLSRPYDVYGGLLEIPVFELDDWFFLDASQGPKLRPEQASIIAEHWLMALRDFKRMRGSLLVIQAHPLRMDRGLLEAVDMFLTGAKVAGCSFVTLSKIRPKSPSGNREPVSL